MGVTGGLARHRPFVLALHLHQRESSRNLHLQYSAKSQSTPYFQSLITARSDHPPLLRCCPQLQHLPFTGKEDLNLHLQKFVQLCQTIYEDGVTKDQVRARLFSSSLLGKALRWFHTLLVESKQEWEALIRNFMKEFYSLTKTPRLRNKIDTFAQFPTETIAEALERFNEYMQAEFLEWHIGLVMRRMEKMEMEREAQDLKAC
jgi:hypothetical protein